MKTCLAVLGCKGMLSQDILFSHYSKLTVAIRWQQSEKITGRDHTTVIYGLNIVSDKLLRDMTFKRFYEGITKDIDSVLNISENKKKSNLQSYRHIDVRN